jgi:hypothetical protein
VFSYEFGRESEGYSRAAVSEQSLCSRWIVTVFLLCNNSVCITIVKFDAAVGSKCPRVLKV